MNRPQLAGIILAVMSTATGTYGLMQSKPLPPSAKLGAMAPLDRNNDGRISGEEWAQGGRPAAEKIARDANGNGYLEPAEVRPARKRGTGK